PVPPSPDPARPHCNLFLLRCYAAHRPLHSFPTRRSSDLHHPAILSPADPESSSQGHWSAPPEPPVSPGSPVFSARLEALEERTRDRKSTRLNSSHVSISYAVFCLKKKNRRNSTHAIAHTH